mmetsp:Transcript_96281/g.171024  ORF Transcript_96281/g.171024 Transcript_96281/m.171024 type:complete len:285 (-) Transcript_96281:73-927(-)|eukprot:CAMPEP_0197621478 /NCGR_PEP_ID=MMETSP1338-20131121/2069_1 /TAXON_ID=43686 ORGANISM="Pelagodinium beii, Strain RCC1491" /NCGR_SAMPLE_ID=MMETSP1338 /ASSEMBLY_ACC=CAM_ASM_000754 /LENGTH=284 /DNA_ID=CAMNT_0043190973 /DNA_START=72 /DNA_END=926 /DNA_ORIENTATION=-
MTSEQFTSEYRNQFIAYDRSRLSDARLSTPPQQAASRGSSESSRTRKTKKEPISTGNTGNNLQARLKGDALATICPPWSTPYCSYVRQQPTTLKYQMCRVSDGLALAQEKLEARRYQPTYADHGLAFRMQQAEKLERGASSGAVEGATPSVKGRRAKTSGKGAKTTASITSAIPTSPTAQIQMPKEEHKKVEYKSMKHPTWWGQAAMMPDPDRATYEDLGEYFPRQAQSNIAGKEMLRAESVPLLYGQYKHDNPFLGTGAPYRRGPGGVVVCDVSLAPKLNVKD